MTVGCDRDAPDVLESLTFCPWSVKYSLYRGVLRVRQTPNYSAFRLNLASVSSGSEYCMLRYLVCALFGVGVRRCGMLQRMELSGGKVVPDGESGNIYVYVNPDAAERKYLVETLKLDEHTLVSALDPDELARL